MNLPPAGRLDALTGLRFFAALYVVLFHCGHDFFSGASNAAEILRQCGFVAVSFFFVLSGFILTYNYIQPGSAAPTAHRGAARFAIDRRRFLVARLSRIYPIYLISLLIMAPFVIRFAPPENKLLAGLASVALLQSWVPALSMSWNAPGWSIAVEALFYALFPLLGALLSRPASNGRLLLYMTLLWALCLLAPALYSRFDPDQLGSAISSHSDGLWLRFVKFAPLCRLPEFFLGVCLGRWFQNDRAAGVARRGGRLSTVALVLLLLFGLGSVVLPFLMLHNGLLAPLFCLLILGQAHGGGLLHRLLSSRPLVLLGDASYGLYILQMPVALYAVYLSGGDIYTHMYGMKGAVFPVYLAVLIGLSLFMYRFVERPLQQRIRRALS